MSSITPDDAPTTAELDPRVVADLLLRSDREVTATAHGGSMGPTIPSGATIRIRRAEPADLRTGCVIAVAAGSGLYTHRVIGVGRTARSRGYLLTRGDGATACDAPVPVAAVLGEVTAWRLDDGWHDIGRAPRRPGWRGPVALLLDTVTVAALDVDVRFAAATARAARGVGRWLPRAPRHPAGT